MLIAAETNLKLSSKAPYNCGINSLQWNELDWSTKLKLTLDDRSDEECLVWMSKIHRYPIANPLIVFLHLFGEAIGEPIQILMSQFGKGIRSLLNQHNFFIQIALLITLIAIVVLVVKEYLNYHLYKCVVKPIKPNTSFLPIYNDLNTIEYPQKRLLH